jgi:hypothetical protein
VDTGINTIVVLGDFNEDQLKPQNNKMSNIFVKYNMIQFINELHGGSVFRTVIILLGIDSPAACNITFKNDSHKSSKLFPELIRTDSFYGEL